MGGKKAAGRAFRLCLLAYAWTEGQVGLGVHEVCHLVLVRRQDWHQATGLREMQGQMVPKAVNETCT